MYKIKRICIKLWKIELRHYFVEWIENIMQYHNITVVLRRMRTQKVGCINYGIDASSSIAAGANVVVMS